MGTRSITRVIDNDWGHETPLVTIYRQYDGYPEGHGRDLAEFITSRRFVNGISGDPTKVFNGAGCFAAALITYLKAERGGDSISDGLGGEIHAGGVYITAPDAPNEEYNYEITVAGNQVTMVVKDDAAVIFRGAPSSFLLGLKETM